METFRTLIGQTKRHMLLKEIRRLRKEGWTLARIGEHLGYTRQYISYLLKKKK